MITYKQNNQVPTNLVVFVFTRSILYFFFIIAKNR